MKRSVTTGHTLSLSDLMSIQPSTESPAIARLRLLIGRTLRIQISDSRLFLGTFACTDRERNVILTNTEEFRLDALAAATSQGRYVGMVMIPWKYVTKAEVEGSVQGLSDSREDLYT